MRAITVAGVQRSYLLSIPASYSASTPSALYFLFHGRGQNHDALVPLGLQKAGVGVFPDGRVQSDGSIGWDSSPGGNDVALFDAVLSATQSSLCIDPARVYAVGFSWGGWMATRLACLRGDVVKGFASIEGGQSNDAAECKGPVPGWINHYRQDPAEPYASGVGATNFFATLNRAANPVSYDAPNPCVRYTGRASVEFCSPEGAVHSWPSYTRSSIQSFFASAQAQPSSVAAVPRGELVLLGFALLVLGGVASRSRRPRSGGPAARC